jgi:rhamnulose-1-phosphate aldolase
MHAVEKAAEILLKVMSVSDRKLQTITPEGFREIEPAFNVKLDESCLYERVDGRIGRK